jgi:predicted nucleic acid-binding protein
MITSHSVRAHYLDASALVKLVADDPDELPGKDVLRQYYYSHASRYATSFCVTETFSAFKLKFLRGRITEDQYIKYCRDFIRTVIGGNLEIIDEVPVLSPVVFKEAERLIQKYKKEIDFIDCFQIITLIYGKNNFMVADSKSILITADRALAKAARAEDVKVWECTSEPAPV